MPWRIKPVRVGSRVEHRQEVGQQFPIRIFDGEIFLVVAHHRDQHFFGQIEKLGIEAAEDDGGKFRQIDDGRDQRLVFAPARAGDGASRRVERFANHLLALGGAKNLRAAQGFDIGAGLGDGDGFAADSH